jgi:hypothetical protein
MVRVRVMVFNATINNISVLSWQYVLLVEGKAGIIWHKWEHSFMA